MQNFLLAVDRLSTFIGRFFAWAIVLLTLMVAWEVFSRYLLLNPHAWALDAQIMLYGILFMMAGAYALAHQAHVRGDILYASFSPRVQAAIDLILYGLFYFPSVLALIWAGWNFANESLAIRENTFSPEPLPLYPFKFVIPVAGALLLLQGVVEVLRCVICLRDNRWPPRSKDVEEIDVEELKAMVKDAPEVRE